MEIIIDGVLGVIFFSFTYWMYGRWRQNLWKKTIQKDVEMEANKAFDILVEHAGATEDYRNDFVRHWGIIEFRFYGNLGNGGKFWINGSPWTNNGKPYINCYPEDMTTEREAIIQTVNGLLA